MHMEITFSSTRGRNRPKDNKTIGDTGTTDNFLREGAPADEIKTATRPTEIKLPNITVKKSTHMCYLRFFWLPPKNQGKAYCPRPQPFIIDIHCKIMQRMESYFQGKHMQNIA